MIIKRKEEKKRREGAKNEKKGEGEEKKFGIRFNVILFDNKYSTSTLYKQQQKKNLSRKQCAPKQELIPLRICK